MCDGQMPPLKSLKVRALPAACCRQKQNDFLHRCFLFLVYLKHVALGQVPALLGQSQWRLACCQQT
jgi:hypothetical protein